MSAPSGFQFRGSAPEVYQRYGVAAIGTAKAQELVALAALQPGDACSMSPVAPAWWRAKRPKRWARRDRSSGLISTRACSSRTHRAPPVGAPITWREGSVLALPFPDATFDAVLCQWGLEFFPDRAHGLREMARVLVPGGRLGLRVWRALERQPFQTAVLAALDRHLFGGQDVPSRATVLQPFTLADAEEVRALVADAGFRDIHVRIMTLPLRFASVEAYTLGFLSSIPIASQVAAMEETARTSMIQEIVAALHPFVDDEGLAAPAEDHVVLARK